MNYTEDHPLKNPYEPPHRLANAMATSGAHNERKLETPRFGYEYQFVQPPPIGLQTQCSVCLTALRCPHLISCCGRNFCKECIGGVQKAGNGCPLCNATGFYIVYNRTHHEILKLLEVYCTHHKSGCEWKGKLEMFEKHLNVDPEPGTQLQGCAFVKVKCCHNGCGQSLERRLLDNHQSKECPQRPFSCEHCKRYKTTFHDVTTNHWPECECFPVSCPNNCTPDKLQRQNLQTHLSEECPLQEVECEFKHVGCETKLCRKDMPEHISDPNEMVRHRISLLTQQVQGLSEQNQQLTKELEKLRLHVETVAPVQIVMTDFEQHKKDGDTWYSEGFYTHPGGYRMCLNVDANGHGDSRGTHVSCFVCLMRGKFDSTLKWPFRGNITIQLLNQRGNRGHYTRIVCFDREEPSAHNTQVICRERAINFWGKYKFVLHSELEYKPETNCQYLMNNSLCFRVEAKLLL